MRPLPLLLCGLIVVGAACARREVRPPPTRRAVQLVERTEEQQTQAFEQRREDVEIDTRDHDRTPRVVASGETALLRLDGTRARLYGDPDGLLGWEVDNVLLLEILDRDGKVLGRIAAGFAEPLVIDGEVVDNLGRKSFTFGPGELDLTARLPDGEPFRIRTTALDYAQNGRVSDVFLVLEPPAPAPADDLRGN